jgi:hypothetical protein
MKRANSRNEQSPGTPDARGRLISELIYLCVKTPKYNVNKSPKKNREGGDVSRAHPRSHRDTLVNSQAKFNAFSTSALNFHKLI